MPCQSDLHTQITEQLFVAQEARHDSRTASDPVALADLQTDILTLRETLMSPHLESDAQPTDERKWDDGLAQQDLERLERMYAELELDRRALMVSDDGKAGLPDSMLSPPPMSSPHAFRTTAADAISANPTLELKSLLAQAEKMQAILQTALASAQVHFSLSFVYFLLCPFRTHEDRKTHRRRRPCGPCSHSIAQH